MIRPFLYLVTLFVCPLASLAQDIVTPPSGIARSYLEAMGRKDLDAAEALFAEKSSVFESGGDEGDWEHYRAHHIGAELDAIDRFETILGTPEEEISADGTMAFVAWPIEYHIALRDDREIDSRGTVTFVLIRSEALASSCSSPCSSISSRIACWSFCT